MDETGIEWLNCIIWLFEGIIVNLRILNYHNKINNKKIKIIQLKISRKYAKLKKIYKDYELRVLFLYAVMFVGLMCICNLILSSVLGEPYGQCKIYDCDDWGCKPNGYGDCDYWFSSFSLSILIVTTFFYVFINEKYVNHYMKQYERGYERRK